MNPYLTFFLFDFLEMNSFKASFSKKKEVIREYNRSAVFYDKRYLNIQRNKHLILLKELKLSFENVLDCGCGTGELVKLLGGEAKDVVGVDISVNMLEIAKKKSSVLANVDFVCADACFLPFKRETFGKVFIVTVLQNIPEKNLPNMLKEVRRVMGRKGLAGVSALKKTIELKKAIKLFEKAGFKVKRRLNIRELEDYVFILQNQI